MNNAIGGECISNLWPNDSKLNVAIDQLNQSYKSQLLARADRMIQLKPAPVKTLKSAGTVNPKDTQLVATRLAFRDADRAVIVALAYRLSNDNRYFTFVKNTLLSWAFKNEPTGHPIDETRLDQLIWSFDLIHCQLVAPDVKIIKIWFENILAAKQQWHFGKLTHVNNHKTHHLKTSVLLERVLNKNTTIDHRLSQIKMHAKTNIDLNSGASVDFNQRQALYYHTYNLEAWIEIGLLTNCCFDYIKSAFAFLDEKLLNNEIDHEFVGSIAKIDQRRAAAGFKYANQKNVFDISRVSRSIIGMATITNQPIAPRHKMIIDSGEVTDQLLFVLLRKELWQRSIK